jgi:hypothetical protein
MQPDPTVSISCDELLEYDDDAAPFAQGEPEFLNGPLPAPAPESAPARSAILRPPEEEKR